MVVSDTSPISSLFRIGQLTLLQELYFEVVIPLKVWEELLVLADSGHDLSALSDAVWLRVESTPPSVLLDQLKRTLDPGEAEAIALAKSLPAKLLLIDEKAGRQAAKMEGIPITGLLGVVLEAKSLGLIPLVKPILNQLIEDAKFRIARDLYWEIIELASEK
jgi:predicted nucleic acid-binding protein